MGGYLESGDSVAYYPEGTRKEMDTRSLAPEIKPGAALLAVERGVPVLPLAIAGLANKDERHVLRGRKPVMAVFGEPIFSGLEQPIPYRSHEGIAAVRKMNQELTYAMQDCLDKAYAQFDAA
jgi:1-acyl-sn-glycerol-3-phosphate acyltransferase